MHKQKCSLMKFCFDYRILQACLVVVCLSNARLFAQAPGVPIMPDRIGASPALIEAAETARANGQLLSQEQVADQLKRESFSTTSLPKPHSIPLHSREIWHRARAAYLRVGWHYLCNRCDNWHQNFAGGFFINPYGLVATCEHVIAPQRNSHREGYLIAASEDGTLYPVVEILASHAPTDVAILRVAVDKPVPYLPLNVNVYPGDQAWCYSYPLRRAGYFSQGIVNRFHYENKDGAEVPRLAVTTDWAPGSSGAAIIDTYGNAIGMVSTITPAGTGRPRTRIHRPQDEDPQEVLSDPTAIIFRTAARAADIIALTTSDQQHVQQEQKVPPETAEEPEDSQDEEADKEQNNHEE